MEKGNALSAEDLEGFRAVLLERKAVLRGMMGSLEEEATRKGAGGADGSSLPLHLAELGSDSHEQNVCLGLVERERTELLAINQALERLDDGTFGRCEECEGPIARERLEAIPYARLCMPCQRKEEEE